MVPFYGYGNGSKCCYITSNLVRLSLTVTTVVIGVELSDLSPRISLQHNRNRSSSYLPSAPMGFKFTEADAIVLIFKIKEVGLRKIK